LACQRQQVCRYGSIKSFVGLFKIGADKCRLYDVYGDHCIIVVMVAGAVLLKHKDGLRDKDEYLRSEVVGVIF